MTSREGASHFFTEVDREVSPAEPDLAQLAGIATAHGLALHVPA